MNRFSVTTERPYEILTGHGILKELGDNMPGTDNDYKVCVITDSKVNQLYADTVMSSISDAGYTTSKIVFPEGEYSKTISTYANILDSLAEEGFSRSDVLVALGGGVVGDLTGFAAATYLRGIRYVQVPTTYLASVDSSVGGKTGVNLLYGKNLAGAFWQPSLVFCDYATFDTLPERELLEGVAEAVKQAMLMEERLIEKILAKDYSTVIERCVSIKKSIVEADERDTGMRQLLNFGHTTAHSIEKLSAYKIPHGQAVAKGMVLESRAAYKMGITDFDASPFLADTFDSFGIDTSISYSPEELCKYALIDKKISGSSIAMVVPEAIGKCRLHKIALSDLCKFLGLGLE